ncbi:unnamed protein product, partial [Prorocentrum cordatum]
DRHGHVLRRLRLRGWPARHEARGLRVQRRPHRHGLRRLARRPPAHRALLHRHPARVREAPRQRRARASDQHSVLLAGGPLREGARRAGVLQGVQLLGLEVREACLRLVRPLARPQGGDDGAHEWDPQEIRERPHQLETHTGDTVA